LKKIFISSDHAGFNLKENINKKKMNISTNTKEKFKNSLKSLNNEKIKKSLIELSKYFKKKWKK